MKWPSKPTLCALGILLGSNVGFAKVHIQEVGQTTFYTCSPGKLTANRLDGLIYKSLKENPLNRKINVVEVPWSVVIDHKKISHMKGQIPRLEGDTITVCSHEHCDRVFPILEEIGVTHLFTTQATKGQRWHNIKMFPVPYYPTITHPPAEKKDILYSFIGFGSHPFRDVIFKLPTRDLPDVVIKRRNSWYLKNKKGLDQRIAEYRNVLSRSRFGLCPRGNSPNTLRLFELMGAGAIPIILADTLYLPPGIDWNKCVIRVKEADARSVDEIIRAIPKEQEEAMRQEGLRVYRVLMDDMAYFVRYALST